MNENEPVEELQKKFDDAAKLRDLVRHPGWTDVLKPYLVRTADGYRNQLVTTQWKTLDEMKTCQGRILVIEELLENIKNTIAQADEIVKQEALKMQEGSQE